MNSYLGDLLIVRPAEGKALILRHLERAGYSFVQAARALGVHQKQLHKVVTRVGLRAELENRRRIYEARRRPPEAWELSSG